MSFGKLRKNLGQSATPEKWELYRLCSKSGISVIGGASKLLSYFKKNYKWEEIISYCHCDISNGNVYEKIGFTFDKNCGQGFSYFKNGKRYNRYTFRKDKIDDGSGKTADEIMYNKGFSKCWDSGVLKYKIVKN